MSTTETKARAEGAIVPDAAGDVKAAMAEFVNDLRAFKDDIETKMQQQEERQTMLHAKSQTGRRPALATSAEIEVPHQKAFEDYIRSGDDDALRGLSLEGKGMSTVVSGDGGYLVDPQTSATVKGVLKSTASIRRIATVVNVESTSYDVLIDTAEMGAGWASESGSVNETGTGQIDRITIPLHELSALPKASQRLLDDSAFDIEGWLAGRIADTFAFASSSCDVFFHSGRGREHQLERCV